MWSRKPIPVSIEASPVPSKSSVTEIDVSFVLRSTVALRSGRSSLRPASQPSKRERCGEVNVTLG
jgi:hypothetical protein